MKPKFTLGSFLLLALFPAMAANAIASNTWYVDGVNGSNHNDCKSPQAACKTIGHAISRASSGDSVVVTAATYSEHFTIGLSLTIVGAGARTTIVDGGHRHSRVVTVSAANAQVTLSQLTIQNGGHYPIGGGILNAGMLTLNHLIISGNQGPVGGAINSSGTVMINDSTISGNLAKNAGAIANAGTMTINNSTLSANSATSSIGGIENDGALTINNSTLVGNTRSALANRGTVMINNSTFNGNSAWDGIGGSLIAAGTTALQNTILANSLSGGNCYGSIISNGYNLSSDDTCNLNGAGDLNKTDPKFGQLGNHGGPTQTVPLLPGSPAIDSGNPAGCSDGTGRLLKTDQRGKPRPDKEDTGGCDMGAYERQHD